MKIVELVQQVHVTVMDNVLLYVLIHVHRKGLNVVLALYVELM